MNEGRIAPARRRGVCWRDMLLRRRTVDSTRRRQAASCAAIAAALVTAFAGAAGAEELRTWRHGLLEAKSDAGFTMMAGLRGFAEKRGLVRAGSMPAPVDLTKVVDSDVRAKTHALVK
jgi:hypothetical protein